MPDDTQSAPQNRRGDQQSRLTGSLLGRAYTFDHDDNHVCAARRGDRKPRLSD